MATPYRDPKRSIPFSAAEAIERGMSRRELSEKVRRGELERVARGWYRVPAGTFSEEQIFQAAIMRVGRPAAICLMSALAYYDLTDIVPRKVWVMVPASKRTKYADIRLLRTRNPRWKKDIERHSDFQITSMERTIVDALCYRSLVGFQVGIEALRRAISAKKTTAGKVMDTAVRLSVAHRIRSYIEALS